MSDFFLAVTWFGQEHRFLGLDWSWLDLLGLVGQALFSFRFVTQWLESERRGVSYIPVSFWYWSIAGSLVLTLYWIGKRSPVGILANLPNTLIYMRNLQLIRRHQLAPTAAAPTQMPVEEAPNGTSASAGPARPQTPPS
jgi:lipid-A-disaccharide synthase-like uncharacterized protein